MILELYLDTTELTQNQILVLVDGPRRDRVDIGGTGRARKTILLESWMLTLQYVISFMRFAFIPYSHIFTTNHKMLSYILIGLRTLILRPIYLLFIKNLSFFFALS